ncbi:MAG: BACON domain-containing protein [Candidatus Cryptobacteroides sp.]
MKRLLLALLCAVILLPSCKKEEKKEVIVNIEQTEYSLPEQGGAVVITFVPLTYWEAACTGSFVSIDPTKGEASKEEVHVKVTVDANDAPYARVIKVKFAFESNTVDITITQDAMTPPPLPVDGNMETEDITEGKPIE